MKTRATFVPVAAFLTVLCGQAAAQVGVQDQVAPASNASYNLDVASLTWQAQIRAGVGGTLEGIRLVLAGAVGAQMDIRIRLGNAPSVNPILFSAHLTKQTPDQETVFVNMTASNIPLTVGQAFVMETQGNGTGCNIIGSYVDPVTGPSLYPEPLYLNGGIFADGWKHGFTTFMLAGPSCYANCDSSTAPPILNANDFQCFLNLYAAQNAAANCDNSTSAPILNTNDFQCFLNKFAAGCT